MYQLRIEDREAPFKVLTDKTFDSFEESVTALFEVVRDLQSQSQSHAAVRPCSPYGDVEMWSWLVEFEDSPDEFDAVIQKVPLTQEHLAQWLLEQHWDNLDELAKLILGYVKES